MSDKPMPHEQDEEGADCRTYEPRSLVRSIPADQLADERCAKRSHNAKTYGENKSRWIVRARRKEARDDARDATDQNDP